MQFPDDAAALKAVYLAIVNIEEKWNMPVQNWGYILHQFIKIFENRCRLYMQLLKSSYKIFYSLS